ncbi:hypothetical protein BDN67DRAFT_1073005 [Paxillus ammoniavirescens]|nr:hypothetical protein BDN67DRAFT_1073005 [Paxillus ammoniavirescens]
MDEVFKKIAHTSGLGMRIYADTQSRRMYDEKGHRFHVHIIAPEAWEAFFLPFLPSRKRCTRCINIPCYQLADGHLPVLPSPASNPLNGIKSIARLDAATKHAEIDPTNLRAVQSIRR